MNTLKTFLLLSVATIAFQARAEYLLWSVDWNAAANETADYAAIVVLNSSDNSIVGGESNPTYLTLAGMEDETPPDNQFLYKDDESPVEAEANVVSPYNSNSYSFALYLYDASGKLVSKSDPATYASLSSSIWANDFNPGVSTTWAPTTYAVPEPATGALLLVGSLLLFRRKRA